MQATCPQCANRVNFDDARAPERPFSVKCPKCQAPVRFPGRAAAAAPAALGSPAPVPAAAPSSPAAPAASSSPVGTETLAQLRRENRRLSQDVEILKRATAFFAKETR